MACRRLSSKKHGKHKKEGVKSTLQLDSNIAKIRARTFYSVHYGTKWNQEKPSEGQVNPLLLTNIGLPYRHFVCFWGVGFNMILTAGRND